MTRDEMTHDKMSAMTTRDEMSRDEMTGDEITQSQKNVTIFEIRLNSDTSAILQKTSIFH
jgi:hypothetical protein